MNVLACTYILLTRPGAGGGWWGGPGRAGGIVRRRSSKAAVVGCWRRIVDMELWSWADQALLLHN